MKLSQAQFDKIVGKCTIKLNKRVYSSEFSFDGRHGDLQLSVTKTESSIKEKKPEYEASLRCRFDTMRIDNAEEIYVMCQKLNIENTETDIDAMLDAIPNSQEEKEAKQEADFFNKLDKALDVFEKVMNHPKAEAAIDKMLNSIAKNKGLKSLMYESNSTFASCLAEALSKLIK